MGRGYGGGSGELLLDSTTREFNNGVRDENPRLIFIISTPIGGGEYIHLCVCWEHTYGIGKEG